MDIELDFDISFIDEMVDEGIVDDGSPLVGDVAFDDDKTYDIKSITNEEVDKYLTSLGINLDQ